MRRLCLVLVAAVCSACSGNSTSPSATSQVSFTGAYTGTYQIVSCADGSLTGFCAAAGFGPGTRLPISLSIGQDHNPITGTLMLGAFTGTFQGTASGASLTGTAAMDTISNAGLSLSTNMTSWSSTLTANSMTGTFNVAFAAAAAGFTQPSTFSASIVSLTR
jgi:hypothetical protein